MTEPEALDPTPFLTTLPQWDRAAFLREAGLAAGALAAVRVVPCDSSARGRDVTEADAVGERLAVALRRRSEPHLTGQLVVVPVGAGAPAPAAAVRAIEDELEPWHHGKPGNWPRWSDAG